MRILPQPVLTGGPGELNEKRPIRKRCGESERLIVRSSTSTTKKNANDEVFTLMTKMTVEEVKEAFDSIDFFPNWRFEVYETDFEGLWVNIIGTKLLDSYNPDKTLDVGVRSALPRFFEAQQVVDWLVDRLVRIASHEVREHLLYKGERIFDPHSERNRP